jgi:alanine racemase
MSARAHIRLDALRENLHLPASAVVGAVVDVRRDAWGHGAPAVAREAIAAGAAALRVDEVTRSILDAAGLGAAALTSTAAPTVDPCGLYGLNGTGRPVMSLSGRVLGTKTLRRGEGVSYGYLYRAARDTRVALVSGGYAQGVVRALGGRASVAIDGRRHPILGRVAMDVCVVDIGDHAVSRGARAMFFGDPDEGAPSVGEWVEATGLAAGELVAAVGLHAERVTA